MDLRTFKLRIGEKLAFADGTIAEFMGNAGKQARFRVWQPDGSSRVEVIAPPKRKPGRRLATIILFLACLLATPARADRRELFEYRLRYRKTAAELVNVRRLDREHREAVAELERIIRDAVPWWAVVNPQ